MRRGMIIFIYSSRISDSVFHTLTRQKLYISLFNVQIFNLSKLQLFILLQQRTKYSPPKQQFYLQHQQSIIFKLNYCKTFFYSLSFEHYFQNQINKFFKRALKLSNLIKKSTFIYNHLTFPLFIGFYWAITLNYFNVRDNQKNSFFESIPIMFSAIISLIFLIVLGCIFWFQWKGILTNQRNKQSYFGLTKCDQNHIPIYLSYVFLINLCLVVQYLGLLTFSKEIIMILTLLLLIKYCYNKPYKSGIHNTGLIFNLLMVQIFIIWTIVRNIFQSVKEEDKQILIIGVLFLLMTTSIIICVARIIYEVRLRCSIEFKKKERELNHQNIQLNQRGSIMKNQNEDRMKQQLSKFNKYCCGVMKQKDKFDDWNQQNKQRLLSDMMGVYNSIDINKKVQGMQNVFKKRVQKQIKNQKQIKLIKSRLKQSFKQKQIGKNRKVNYN